MYEYAATIIRVVDGDTFHAQLDLGCDVHVNLTIRFARINAPEMSTPGGPVAKAYVEQWVAAQGGKVVLRTAKDKRENYGRYLAEVFASPLGAGPSLNQILLDNGLAEPYPKR